MTDARAGEDGGNAGLEALEDYFRLILTFDNDNRVALDRNHNLFLMGALLARKPARLLELGIGTGYVTRTLLHGIRYNGRGTLTSVDNFMDWEGQEPSFVEEFRRMGATIVAPMGEEEFVKSSADDAFDFLVSDADHRRSGTWVDHHLRIISHDGFMFFHDTNHKKKYQSLKLIERRIRELQLPYFHFTESTRPDEACERGWLFAINKKRADAPLPKRSLWARLRGR
jgi:predicted O-methyltransferase YrrM